MDAANCEKTCTLEIGHAEAQCCGVKLHCCGQPCQASACRGICCLPFEAVHDQHSCGASRCQQSCDMLDCGNTCSVLNHFHDSAAEHICGQSHRCTMECQEEGICEIKVHLQKNTDTFAGQRSTFEFCRQEMNGNKRKCSRVMSAGLTAYGNDHGCDNNVHYCPARCPCCQYYCDKPVGHSDLHRTSHGNMKDTYFVSDATSVDIGGRQYVSGKNEYDE